MIISGQTSSPPWKHLTGQFLEVANDGPRLVRRQPAAFGESG